MKQPLQINYSKTEKKEVVQLSSKHKFSTKQKQHNQSKRLNQHLKMGNKIKSQQQQKQI